LNVLKRITFPIISLFLAYRTEIMFSKLISSDPSDYGLISMVLIAFLLNLFITGVFAFLGFAYSTHKLLPKAYYKIRNPKLLKTLGDRIGINYFKYLLLLFFWGKEKNRKKYFNGTKAGLTNFIYQTKQSEFGHIGAFVIIFLLTLYLLAFKFFLTSIIMTLINIIGNIYPVILQRLHRVRIERIGV